VQAEAEVRAVAFARLKVGAIGFAGLARDEGILDGAKTLAQHRATRRLGLTWDELIAQWRREVDALGDEFVRGEARVDPKRGLATCRDCDLQALCRVHERLGGIAEADVRGDEEAREGAGAPEGEEVREGEGP